MSLVLRHKPGEIGLELDENGWASIEDLVNKMNTHGFHTDIETIYKVVIENDKQRFALSDDKTKVRASQGHSINVELNLPETIPPLVLYHGTVEKNLSAIRKDGLHKMNRQHVHLSADRQTAINVGSRYGTAVVLVIRAAEMHQRGYKFYLSANGVWLAALIPAEFIDI